MKRQITIILIVLLQFATDGARAQNNPKQPAGLNNNPNLALLGKVWGLLKYHHPAVIKGTYN